MKATSETIKDSMAQMKSPLMSKLECQFITAERKSATISIDPSNRPEAAAMIERRMRLARR